jgi:hypothetical protein
MSARPWSSYDISRNAKVQHAVPGAFERNFVQMTRHFPMLFTENGDCEAILRRRSLFNRAKMMLTYDDNAFMFFAITILFVYSVPALLVIANRIASFQSTPKPVGLQVRATTRSYFVLTSASAFQLALQARTAAEAEKIKALSDAAAAAAPKLWTKAFKIWVGFTIFTFLLAILLMLLLGEQKQLAEYNPYEVGPAPSKRWLVISKPWPVQVLGLAVGDTEAAIKKAYRALSLRYHPDKPTGDEVMFQVSGVSPSPRLRGCNATGASAPCRKWPRRTRR